MHGHSAYEHRQQVGHLRQSLVVLGERVEGILEDLLDELRLLQTRRGHGATT